MALRTSWKESLELLNSSRVTPAGLSHVFPLSFLHATGVSQAEFTTWEKTSCHVCTDLCRVSEGVCLSAVVGLLA